MKSRQNPYNSGVSESKPPVVTSVYYSHVVIISIEYFITKPLFVIVFSWAFSIVINFNSVSFIVCLNLSIFFNLEPFFIQVSASLIFFTSIWPARFSSSIFVSPLDIKDFCNYTLHVRLNKIVLISSNFIPRTCVFW